MRWMHAVSLMRWFTPVPKPQHLLTSYYLGGRRALLTVSRLSKLEGYKGHDRVIELLPELRQKHLEVVYVVAGDDDDRPRLGRLARNHAAEKLVRFVGRRSDGEIVEHYRRADVIVMLLIGEYFGIFCLEAITCGILTIGLDGNISIDLLEGSRLKCTVIHAMQRQTIADSLADTPPEAAYQTSAGCFSSVVFHNTFLESAGAAIPKLTTIALGQ